MCVGVHMWMWKQKGWCLLSLSQVRLYDTRAQRRPIYSTEFGDSPVTTLTVLEDGRCVLTWDVVTLPLPFNDR